jgi:ketosteroid isomerase-like protein
MFQNLRRVAAGMAIAALALLGARGAAAQTVTAAALDSWLSRYEQAWETRSAAAAAALFTENAVYREAPFEKPMEGRNAISEYWSTVTADQRDIDFRYEVIAVNGDKGVAHWSAVFKLESTGERVALDGVFVLTFNAAGQCTLLREWWQAGSA